MKHGFGVTICESLELDHLKTASGFGYATVIDLRFSKSGDAQAINENVLRRLRNLHVKYVQCPLDFRSAGSREENDLMRSISDRWEQVLLLTNDARAVARFCEELNIPCQLKTELPAPIRADRAFAPETAGHNNGRTIEVPKGNVVHLPVAPRDLRVSA